MSLEPIFQIPHITCLNLNYVTSNFLKIKESLFLKVHNSQYLKQYLLWSFYRKVCYYYILNYKLQTYIFNLLFSHPGMIKRWDIKLQFLAKQQKYPMQKTEAQLEKKCYTFAGGPTMAPDFLKQSLSQQLFDPDNSLLNMNSNTKQCQQMIEKTKGSLRNLLNIPNSYQIWFCSGGVHLQFAGIPMNYSGGQNVVANYTTTGYFSNLAFKEGRKFLNAHSIAQMTKDQFGKFVLPKEFDYAPNAVFTHFVENQTVQGLEYPDDRFPHQPGVPLLNDCSSSVLTRPIDWSKITMAYAHAQKNCGISGATIMIVDQKFLKTSPCPYIPSICDLRMYQEKGGFPSPINSSIIFSILKMSENMLQSGGIDANRYRIRSNKIYNVLDKYPIYIPKVNKRYRSRINVTWECSTPEIAEKCVNEGIQNGLYEFKGHRTVGGFRASLFNPVSDEAVEKLADFLDKFGQKHQN